MEIILKVLPVMIAIISCVIGFLSFRNSFIDVKKKSFENYQHFLEKRIEFNKNASKVKKVQKDLLIRTVSFLDSFDWDEIGVLVKKDFGLKTLINLNNLKKEKLISIVKNDIVIPSWKFVYKKYYFNFFNLFFLISFILYVVFFLIMMLIESLSFLEYIGVFFWLLVLEFIVLIRFDGLITYNVLINDIKNGFINNKDIKIKNEAFYELVKRKQQPLIYLENKKETKNTTLLLEKEK